MTFGRRSTTGYVGSGVLVADPQPGQSVLYRRTLAEVVRVWQEPIPSGRTIRLAQIQFGDGKLRTVFASTLEQP